MRRKKQEQAGTDELTNRIRKSVATLLESSPFKSWLVAHKLSEGSLVGINNSFVFRDQLKTTKNPYFLSVKADGKGAVSHTETVIASGTQFDIDFKLFSAKSGSLPSVETLAAGVARELRRFGKLAFVLVGHIEDNIRVWQPIHYALFDEVTLDPTQADLLRLERRS